MQRVLILGAGLVARPLVRYLLEHPDFCVTVASRTVSKAQQMIAGHRQGQAIALDMANDDRLDLLVEEHDLAVSLLPSTHHVRVAQSCIAHGKHMVTTSYVSEAMRALDGAAKEAGIIILNEIGVDPGIDHMAAMKIIHRVQAAGGEITSFTSWCGGLPAPEANSNPLGYKFSWSPRGVIAAGRSAARFLRDGQEVFISGEELFDHYWMAPIEGLGDFEGYPNRNSLPYMETYGIPTTRGMFRGTLRNEGWCATLKKLGELGLFSDEERHDLTGLTFRELSVRLVGSRGDRLEADLAAYLGIEPDAQVMSNLAWLGLWSDEPLPAGRRTLLGVLAARMLQKMSYEPGERDMLILQHEFLAQYPDGQERITSTLIDFGIPYGDSSMSRTVGLPAAIGVKMVLQGQIAARGVLTPVLPEIYEPALAELEELGIRCVEKSEVLA
ncbi:MAG: saccharopine dehydrogenase NADP-binding domain-containing protein [Chloroflexi bacterium]|nr:saccharopine dehydrogenase NADP-binding domain-containing protein [Chloroflexota bacterium]